MKITAQEIREREFVRAERKLFREYWANEGNPRASYEKEAAWQAWLYRARNTRTSPLTVSGTNLKITLTVDEIFDRGIWDEVCQMKGFNEWAVKEGLIDSDEPVTFTEKEAKQLGILN